MKILIIIIMSALFVLNCGGAHLKVCGAGGAARIESSRWSPARRFDLEYKAPDCTTALYQNEFHGINIRVTRITPASSDRYAVTITSGGAVVESVGAGASAPGLRAARRSPRYGGGLDVHSNLFFAIPAARHSPPFDVIITDSRTGRIAAHYVITAPPP